MFSSAPQLPLSLPTLHLAACPPLSAPYAHAGQGGGADPGSLPRVPHHCAQHVSLPYMKEGSPHADALWAAQTPAAQRGAACVPEEAAPLARLCLAFIGNEDEGFGSGLRGSP